MHVLLTGASGFIGKNLAEYLLKAGITVTVPLRKEALKKIARIKKYSNLNVLVGEFFDFETLNAIRQAPDVIVHLAAIRGAGRASVKEYEQINVQGTQNLIHWAKENEVPRFLYISTVGVLGSIPHKLPARHIDLPVPDGIYHKTKFLAEQLVLQNSDVRFKTLILRPTITYGPQDDGFLKKMVWLIQTGKMVFPRKNVLIHLLDVLSFAKLIKQLIENDLFNNQTYLIADEAPISITDLAFLIQKFKKGKYWRLPDFLFNVGKKGSEILKSDALKTSLQLISESWYYDISQAIKELHYQPVKTGEKLKEYLQTHVY